MVYPQVRAIYQNGVLTLLEPLDLPEGAQVRLDIQFTPPDLTNETYAPRFVHPNRFAPAKKLDNLIGLVAIGGDALADSEVLFAQPDDLN
jgi:predicted DNA-binding antitoxin AbrB/MazE fold protein